jgi:hypothetical protein
MNVRHEVILVTPALAEEMLKRNTSNRNIRPNWVEYLARQIIVGGWKLTTDAVGIRKDGVLTNGQHRLLAVIKADIPAIMLVVRGIEADAYLVTDRGRSRSLNDVLKLGTPLIADANLIAEVLGRPRLSEPEVKDVVTWWKPAHVALDVAIGGRYESGFSSAAFRVGAGVRWATERTDIARAYVLAQYRAVTLSAAPDMSIAGAALWKRWLRDKPGSGMAGRRVMGAVLAYYYFDSEKAGTSPLIRNPQATLLEMREFVGQLEAMFINAGVGTAHPYAAPVQAVEPVLRPGGRRPQSDGDAWMVPG